MFDLFDPDTFWLNVTNVALGTATLTCCIAIIYGVAHEIRKRTREYRMKHITSDDPRKFLTNLGITMADGGERIDKQQLSVSEKGLVVESKSKSTRRSKK